MRPLEAWLYGFIAGLSLGVGTAMTVLKYLGVLVW